ncbi:Fructosamine kinase-domain-containing protein [Xylariomycetidae sp. FL2044]|nr:Fructosamine kinase-domain-containing protein [Xylariomycetidae sp. FL2044]
MTDSTEWLTDIEGNFPIHKAVVAAMPKGTRVVAAQSHGTSSWTKTAKVSVELLDGSPKRYFLKCASGQGALAVAQGEFHSASSINAVVPDLVPKAFAWGEYPSGETPIYFFLGDFRDMQVAAAPDPEQFMARIADLHRKGASPNGMFGYPVTTACGKMERTVKWEESWAESFTHQLKDVIRYDNETNGRWPEYDAACRQVIDGVIPKLLGALQSEGRQLRPSLIHGDLWEQNVGIDNETGEITYAHNEMEFGTWRCWWSTHFHSPIYQQIYQRHIEPSEPAEQWDDRNRLYSIHPYLNDSAGHPGSISRKIAYNDMLYLCEKYAPSDNLERYDPGQDISLTGAHTKFVVKQLE